MIKKLFLNNTSKAVRLPAELLKMLGIEEYIKLTFDGKRIIIEKPEEKEIKEA